MKTNYRGFTIEAYRDKSLTGLVLIFYSIFRTKDQKEFDAGFSYSDGTVRDFIKEMKCCLDDFFNNPNEYDFEL